MIKLAFIALVFLMIPIATGIMETLQSDRNQQRLDINLMADRDRTIQAVRLPNRRMKYAAIGKRPEKKNKKIPHSGNCTGSAPKGIGQMTIVG